MMTIVSCGCRTHPGAIVTHHHLPALAVHAGAKLCTGTLKLHFLRFRTLATKTDPLKGRHSSRRRRGEGRDQSTMGEDLYSYWVLNAALTHTIRQQLHFPMFQLKLSTAGPRCIFRIQYHDQYFCAQYCKIALFVF